MKTGVAVLLLVGATSVVQAQKTSIDHNKFMGTWQIMTVKNLKTGAVDSIFKRRLLWTQYTRSTWTYIYSDTGRTGASQAEVAKMVPADRKKANYAKMFGKDLPTGATPWRFWGSGGTYWFDGDKMYYTNLISIEPSQLQLGGIEQVIYLNDTSYAYRNMPDANGVVFEYTHKRLDHGAPVGGEADSGPAALIGNWQVMSQKNLKTGQVTNVAIDRANWFHVTQNHWTFLWMTKDRKNVIPDAMAKLPPEQQIKERYAKIWDEQDKAVFWASAGTYHVENGKFMVEPRVMSIEPAMVGVSGVEPIVTLDRHSYVYQSPPNGEGEVTETTHRRIDW